MLYYWTIALALLSLAPLSSLAELDNYGKWSEALNFVESYENSVEPSGKRYFACQGKRLKPADPLQSWWRERCFDDIKEEPRKIRLCNSTVACCFKFCVLQRLEWLTDDFKYDHAKAHHYLKKEYKKHDYPDRIIDDIVDETEICAEWYEQHDDEDCAKNSAFFKCLTQVVLTVCDREGPDDFDNNEATTPEPTTSKPHHHAPIGRSLFRSAKIAAPWKKVAVATNPGTAESDRTSLNAHVTFASNAPSGATSSKFSTCVRRCKDLCLGRTVFS
jgi:hypothetical protein